MNPRRLYRRILLLVCISLLVFAVVAYNRQLVSHKYETTAGVVDTAHIAIDPAIRDSFRCLYLLLQEMMADPQGLFRIPALNNFFSFGGTRLVYSVREMDSVDGGESFRVDFDDGIFRDTMYLNSFYLSGRGSREYLAALVAHETMHAYIMWTALCVVNKVPGGDTAWLKSHFPVHWENLESDTTLPDEKQHTIMSQNLVETMASVIKLYTNPAISPLQRERLARALAWGGLFGTEEWQHVKGEPCVLRDIEYLSCNMNLKELDLVDKVVGCLPIRANYRNKYKLRGCQ
jgi:hypothetical protein